MDYFSIMKKLLLSGYLLVTAATSWSQQKKDPNPVMYMQQYWDSLKKKNEAQLKAPVDLLKKKQTAAMKEQFSPKRIIPSYINKNVMPVLSPDSDYVYNMPGTHAFDPSQAKGGIIFVTGKVEKIPISIDKKK